MYQAKQAGNALAVQFNGIYDILKNDCTANKSQQRIYCENESFFLEAIIDWIWKICNITINNEVPAVVATETTLQGVVSDNEKRRDVMGDKGGKKNKEKGQKQNVEKVKQNKQNKLDKQPKRKP